MGYEAATRGVGGCYPWGMKLLPVGYETATLLRGRGRAGYPPAKGRPRSGCPRYNGVRVPPASAVGHDGAWPSHCGQDGAWPSRDGATIGCVPINLNPLNPLNLLNSLNLLNPLNPLHPLNLLNLLNLLNNQDRYIAEM